MKLNTSSRQILAISAPIMLGSAAQNVIALSDSIFLYHVSPLDFASIGFVGIFYLIVAAIGYGFSRGGQVIIARRLGEGNPTEVGRTFYSMLAFELALSVVLFLFMQYGCQYFFKFFIESEAVYQKCLEYLDYRSWGVFFSYAGVAIIALYVGIARTNMIIVGTFLLAIVNIILNYGLIFGRWGLPEMGIGGAGLASTIAEIAAIIAFVTYMIFDKKNRALGIFDKPSIDMELIRRQVSISFPMVVQSFAGLGSWFIFVSLVEKMGEHELAITNVVRVVYLILSIPTWGFASGINTIVSNFIGQQRRDVVFPITRKTARLNLLITLVITLPVLLFPETILYPLFGGDDMSLITDSKPTFIVLFFILVLFATGGIFFNAIIGTGATFITLSMQLICITVYMTHVLMVVNYTENNLPLAWAAELLYWLVMLGISMWYLRSKRWYSQVV